MVSLYLLSRLSVRAADARLAMAEGGQLSVLRAFVPACRCTKSPSSLRHPAFREIGTPRSAQPDGGSGQDSLRGPSSCLARRSSFSNHIVHGPSPVA